MKVISKDLKALNNLDKENPGMIDDAFETSRAVKVEVSESLTNRVGGQMSDRFPMKSSKGKKGFFTAPEVGDFCVHEIHGIGRVLGNKKISI